MRFLKWAWRLFRKKPKKKPVKKTKPPKINLLDVLEEKVRITETFQRRPNTMVRIRVDHDGQIFCVLGFSKVCHPDKWDECRGVRIAVRDALIYLIQHYHLRPVVE